MTLLEQRLDSRRRRRPDIRQSRCNKLLWVEGPGSRQLEQRALLTLTVTSFPIPLVGLVQPQGITMGPDGNLWFAETGSDKIGRMTPAGVVTQFALPAIPEAAGASSGTPPGPVAITVGSDGALWFAGVPGVVGRITTAGVVTEFAVPDVPPPAGSPAGTPGTPATLSGITAGPDGALWFTGVPGEVGRITTTGVVTEFPVSGNPTGITAGPDGALWFTGVTSEVGRITTAGVVTEFAVPNGGTVIETPAGITVGPDGALWFTAGSLVGRVSTSGVVNEYSTPNFEPGSTIAVGPDGNLWFLGESGNTDIGFKPAIGRLTPGGAFTSFSIPGNFQSLPGLTPGPDGDLWFTEAESDDTFGEQPAVGEISPAGVTTLHPIAQGTTLDPNRGVDVDPTAITTGPDGALWFTDNAGIGRITTDGTIEQFPLTTPGVTAENITSGPDDTLWFTQQGDAADDDGRWWIGRITTAGAITTYALPPEANPAGITEAADGDLWFTDNIFRLSTGATKRVIGRITPSGVITTFAIPIHATSLPGGFGPITTGPDGDVWFAGEGGALDAVIGRVSASGHITMFHIRNSSPYSPDGPYSLISGPDGKLWFDCTTGRRNHTTTGIARVSTRGASGPTIPAGVVYDLTLMPNGQVWFLSGTGAGEDNSPSLSVATRSGIVVSHDLPAQDLPPTGWFEDEDNGGPGISSMTAGPDGNLWLTNGVASIVRVSGLD